MDDVIPGTGADRPLRCGFAVHRRPEYNSQKRLLRCHRLVSPSVRSPRRVSATRAQTPIIKSHIGASYAAHSKSEVAYLL
jgi:hypothetical protein